MELKRLSGGTLIEIIMIIFICVSLCAIFMTNYYYFGSLGEKAPEIKCRNNLDQLGKALALYKGDYGSYTQWPDASGAYFLGRLYKLQLLSESKVYICPCVDYDNSGINLGKTSGLLPEDISYTGRKNRNQKKYPGIYQLSPQILTTIASDDFEGDINHNDYGVNYLFLDGHTYKFKIPSLKIDSNNYKAYAGKQGKYFADPLTN